MNRARIVVLAAVAASILAVGRPAEAACVTAELVVHRAGQSSVTVLPAGTCVTPTPWPSNGTVGADYRDNAMPTGVPNGVDAWVGLTSP